MTTPLKRTHAAYAAFAAYLASLGWEEVPLKGKSFKNHVRKSWQDPNDPKIVISATYYEHDLDSTILLWLYSKWPHSGSTGFPWVHSEYEKGPEAVFQQLLELSKNPPEPTDVPKPVKRKRRNNRSRRSGEPRMR